MAAQQTFIQFNKDYFKKLSIIISVALFFFVVVGVLVFAPKVVELTESKLIVSANKPSKQPQISDITNSPDIQKPISLSDKKIPPPGFSAKGVLAQDFISGEILFSKDGDKRLPPASTTKIMTALVAVEYFKPADILTVQTEDLVGGSSMGLKVGEKLTFRSLLYGMMLNSGNDAAYTIASNFPGGIKAFVARMNEKAVELSLQNTHFVNPAGFDNPNHFSSALDLGVLAKEAVYNWQIARIVSTKETSVVSYDKSNSHNLKNLNKLLAEDGVMGIKTGYTEQSGENLVGLVDRQNRKILTVILNSSDRFGESKALMDWVYKNYSWQ